MNCFNVTIKIKTQSFFCPQKQGKDYLHTAKSKLIRSPTIPKMRSKLKLQ